MDFTIPQHIADDVDRFRRFLKESFAGKLAAWLRAGELQREFFAELGQGGWYGTVFAGDRLRRGPALREAMIAEEFAKVSPGAAVAALAHADLGLMGLALFGSASLQERYGAKSVQGETVMCLGNTERQAGSDVAAVALRAEQAAGGWVLSGAKAYVTNGAAADLAVVTAVTDPAAARNSRHSMFLVDLSAAGIRRTRLNKPVWIPSDLTRIEFERVFVGADHLLGERGRGLPQVLSVFTHSRVPIAALSLGTAAGAFELAVNRAARRSVFGRPIAEFQAKAFEMAELHARIEAARLMVWRTCAAMDAGEDFRAPASMAKFLAVDAARTTAAWAADLFGAASVVRDHPIHKYPLDAWAASLGEGTQDIQKLVIFRELMKRFA
ncbi:MAG: acyl-CoA dehydrogenase family protein [Desulfobacterales bacterium]|nr:acyl-CoA dehydrogenase family protein [Desulfobacterales bacterium]